MNIIITGSNSGIGLELANRLAVDHNVTRLSRAELDLADINELVSHNLPGCDMLINCAGTGVGGKIDFVNHQLQDVHTVLTVNLLAPIGLAHRVLSGNPQCKIVNITSTNNNHYWPNDLAYSLSKLALAEFGRMLQIEYPAIEYLEIRLGLTQTNFNQNRYVGHEHRYSDIYTNPHLTVQQAVDHMLPALFDPAIKFIEVAP
jgi:short-subunit dehydrogenase